jgi:aminopeptidase YwaD
MRTLLSIVFFLTSSISVLRAQPSPETAKAHFKTDITYLASEKLEGRLAGSPGDKLSAEYIAAEFAKAGLKPWQGTTLQSFDIVQLRIATNKCRFQMYMDDPNTDFAQSFTLYEEFFPVSESSNNDSTVGAMVHCGYGLEVPTMGINSYADAGDVKGKICVIQLGFPGDDTAVHSPLAPYAELAQKVKTALSHGASGVIFIPGSARAEVPKGELQRNAQTFDIPVIYFKKTLPPKIHLSAKIVVNIAAPGSKAYNVLGYKNNRKKRTVIICAHHDHLGHNEFNNSLHTGPQAIHNGADDNASGVATMLELARNMKGRKYKKNNYLFVAFSGEEIGLLGSKYFIQNVPVETKTKFNYVVNMDMVGRMDSNKNALMINGVGTSPTWPLVLQKIAYDSNQVHLVTSESGLGPSDHATFYLEGIPVLHFFTGQHMDYHKPNDDEEKINYDGMYKTYSIIVKTIAATNRSGKLVFTKTKDIQPGRRSFKVTMGVMPDYSFNGVGMRIDGVTDGKPAQKAGLLKGDIITQLGEWHIANVQDYMKALGTFEKGSKTKVLILRDGVSQTVEIEF